MTPLVFGAPRRSASPAAKPVAKSKSPLVFGADLPAAAPEAPVRAPPRRPRREPQWDLVRKGRCPYCGARLKVSVVATEPVFEVVDSGDDGYELREAVDYVPAMLRVECPVCGRSWDVPRVRKFTPVEEFGLLLQYVT